MAPSAATNKKGQTLVEYLLVLVLIAVVVAVLLPPIATALMPAYTEAAVSLGG